MWIFKLLVVLAVLCSGQSEAEELANTDAVGDHGLIEMLKLDSARGVFEGAIKRYENNLDTSKSILVIHSRTTVVSEWILWVIWTKSGLLGCVVSQNSTAPSLVAINLDSDNPEMPKIIKKIAKITNIIEINRKVFSGEVPDGLVSWDIRVGKKVDGSLEGLKIVFPEDDLVEPHHELKTHVEELVRLMIAAAV